MAAEMSHDTTLDSLHQAAIKGQFRAFENTENLEELVTPCHNTILHVHITSRTKTTASANFVKQVLQKCPDLLWKVNSDDESLLHIAARHGHDDIVDILLAEGEKVQQNDQENGIGGARQMLQMKNREKNTPLHEAARYNHALVARLLIERDPGYLYGINSSDETPLYLAVEREFYDVASVIFRKCEYLLHQGPNRRSTLHAAALRNDIDMVKQILTATNPEFRLRLIKEADEKGYTPFHYSTRLGYLQITELFFACDSEKSMAYVPTKKGKTALHLAARQGDPEIMKALLKLSPGCCELVDNKGRNVAHFAVKSKKANAIKYVLSNACLSSLINDKDAQGNRPIDLVDASEFELLQHFKRSTRVDMLSAKASRKKMDHPCKKSESEDDQKAIDGEAKEAHLVVAALIATVAFAAGFTLPGGYKGEGNPNEGGAILSRNTAFKAFVISDTIAMILSSVAIYLHLNITANDKGNLVESLFKRESMIIINALYAMVAAFVAGTYATLSLSSEIAIATCVVACIFFISSGILEILILGLIRRLVQILAGVVIYCTMMGAATCWSCFVSFLALMSRNAAYKCYDMYMRLLRKCTLYIRT